MRRGVSIALILFFWLGPLAAALEASGESRLPACCRRHGMHHCMMSAATSSQSGSGPSVHAPSHCPSYPGNLAVPVTAQKALAVCAANLLADKTQTQASVGGDAHLRQRPVQKHAGRGPPPNLFG